MSRGFVKEGDQEERPIIPPRAPLPAGVPNYVSPQGHQELKAEEAELLAERARLVELNGVERRYQSYLIEGKLQELRTRINHARVIDWSKESPEDIRFGARLKVKVLKGPQAGKEMFFQIVGVDEASPAQGKIPFTAPIAKAALGKRVGEEFRFLFEGYYRIFKVLSFEYEKRGT
jgi:transcription elongation factor GreB